MRMEQKIKKIKNFAHNAQLIIVTKYQPLELIKQLYHIGEREFGENKVQDLIQKQKLLPNDIKWHMIGHLQRNKVKLIAPFIHMIQSVDSLRLLSTIDKYAKQNNRIIKCLIQIKIAQEESKFGFEPKDAMALFNSNTQKQYANIKLSGIMCMASFTNDTQQINQEFKLIKDLFDQLKLSKGILSMGMSNDYQLAYQNGSNMLRIGSAIFN